MKDNIYYIAEFNLPNSSAYALQVLKMCDAFKKKGYNTSLLLPYNKSNYSKIKRDYLLKEKIKIISFYKTEKSFNFLSRILYSYNIFRFLNNKNDKIKLIISRSIVASIFLCIFNIKNTLEIHHELSGITKLFFLFLKIHYFKKNVNFVFIHKNLRKKVYNNHIPSIILDDATDLMDFKNIKLKMIKNACAYTGSLYKGKGLELIIKIAKLLNSVNFYVYGDLKTLKKEQIDNKLPKNIKLEGKVSYSQIPKILSKFQILLMPYQKQVNVRHKNLNVAIYMSPLKMFDYLAAGKIIIASNISNYKHILKNNYNCFLCNPENQLEWSKKINYIFKKSNNLKYIKKNSLKTARNYSWDLRVEKLIKFVN